MNQGEKNRSVHAVLADDSPQSLGRPMGVPNVPVKSPASMSDGPGPDCKELPISTAPRLLAEFFSPASLNVAVVIAVKVHVVVGFVAVKLLVIVLVFIILR